MNDDGDVASVDTDADSQLAQPPSPQRRILRTAGQAGTGLVVLTPLVVWGLEQLNVHITVEEVAVITAAATTLVSAAQNVWEQAHGRT